MNKVRERLLFSRLLPSLAVIALLVAAILLVADVQDESSGLTVLNLWILGLGLIALLLLLTAIGARLYGLIRDLRHGTPGAHLTRRLVGIFLLLTLPPVLIVFFFSLEFLQETIDGWLDVGQEQALEDSLELGRLFIDLRTLEAQREVSELAKDLTPLLQENTPDWFPVLIEHVSSSGPVELSILDDTGATISVASILANTFQADRPRDFTLLQTIENGNYAAAEPVLTQAGSEQATQITDDIDLQTTDKLKIRAAIVLTDSDSRQPIRILQAIYNMPDSFSLLAGNIERAVFRNQTITFLRGSLKVSFVIILSLVLLLSIFLAILAALSAAQRLVKPLTQLAQATGEVASGEYHQELSIENRDELGFLVQSFNNMSIELETSRHNLETQRQYLETVLGRLSAGVLSLNDRGELITSNASASAILGHDLQKWHNQHLSTIRQQAPELEPLLNVLLERREQAVEWRSEIQLSLTDKTLALVCRGSRLALADDGQVVVFDDVTVLTEAQREAAWSEVAKRLAHEVKNPLTPIRLSAERLGMKLEPVLNEEHRILLNKATNTIVNQVEALQTLVNAFADYAQDSKKNWAPIAVHDLLRDVATLYEMGAENTRLRLDLNADPDQVNGNAGRLRQVLHNVVGNAQEACNAAAIKHAEIVLKTRNTQHNNQTGLELIIIDNGPGIDREILTDVFQPYVSTKTANASHKTVGLGLAIVKRIIEEHTGFIELHNLPENGACVSIWLPLANQVAV